MTARPERAPSGLGRGLAALIPQRATAQPAPVEIPIARIKGNPYQPRRRIDRESLEQLAASIAEHGVLQPVLVSETLDGYQLIAGERRVRASQMAGLERVPAVVREVVDRDQLQLALVENLQRLDLNALEEARAFRQLIDEFALSQEQLGAQVGRARSTIANSLRLLDSPETVQQMLAQEIISEGHARAVAALAPAQQVDLLTVVVRRDLSVRQTEELARRLRPGQPEMTSAEEKPIGRRRTKIGTVPVRLADADRTRIERDLQRALDTKVTLTRSRRGGRIVIEFYSDEELSRLFDRLTRGST